jgi:gliding motility-associated-like protein
MKAIFYLLLALLCFIKSAHAQLPVFDWYRCFGGNRGEAGNSVCPTSDGGFIIAGISDSWNDGDVSNSHGLNDFWIVKTNATGQIEWQRDVGSFYLEEARSVRETSDGGYIVAGMASLSEGDVSGSHGAFDFWVVKFSHSGDIEWQKCYGGGQEDFAHSLEFTSDGGYIIVGYTESSDQDVSGIHGIGPRDMWIIKIGPTGNLIWQKCIGGSGKDDANSVRETNDGGYIIAGYTASSDGDASGNRAYLNDNLNYWIVKLNSSGNIEWQKAYGGSRNDIAWSAEQTPDGGYIVAGETQSFDDDVTGYHGGVSDGWVLKLSQDGNVEWKKCMGSSGEDGLHDVVIADDGNYVFAGYAWAPDGDVTCGFGDTDVWTFKLSPTGDMIWQRSFQGSANDAALSLAKISGDEYIISGNTVSDELNNFHKPIDDYSPPDVLLIHLTDIDLTKVKVSVTGPTAICEASAATYTASLNFNLPSSTYEWLINDNVVAANQPLGLDNITTETMVVCKWQLPASCANNAFAWFDTIYVKLRARDVSAVSIAPDKMTACKGQPVTFNVSVAGDVPIRDYQWLLNGETIGTGSSTFMTSSLKPADQVACRVLFAESGCNVPEVTSPPISIEVNNIPSVNIYPGDTVVAPGATLRIRAATTEGAHLTWAPVGVFMERNDQYAVTFPLHNEEMIVAKAISTAGCMAADTTFVRVSSMFNAIPNAFTPNGDGINDEFFILASATFRLKELMIFDRWGNRIFSSKSVNEKWRGTFNGKPSPPGAYVFVVTGTEDERPVSFKGIVYLIK